MKIVTNLNVQKWNEFIGTHPFSNIFQSSEMYNVYKSTFKYEPISLAVEDNDEKIIGVLLALVQKEGDGFLGFLSTRAIIIGGPLIKDNKIEILNFILDEYKKYMKKKVIYSQFRNMWEWTEDEKIIFSKHGFGFDEHLNILVDISKNQNELWSEIKKNRKEGIRKAQRNNLHFEVSNSLSILPSFYNLLKESYSNIKLPFPDIDFFKNAIQIVSPENVKFFILKKEEKIVVCLIAFIFNNRLSAFYIGTTNDEEILKMRPVDLFYWEVIKWGSENNCLIFDWMGAGKPNVDYGVRQFKLQYGGIIVEHGRFLHVNKPFLYKMGTLGLKLFSRLR